MDDTPEPLAKPARAKKPVEGPEATTAEILNEALYASLAKTEGFKVTRRVNTALNKGGSVDILSTSQGVLAVVRHVKVTPAIVTEVTPLLDAAKAKSNPAS
jgi:hypothetical protein